MFYFQDKAGMGRAYGNIGNAYSAAGFYEQAIKYHKQELTISKEVHDRSSEASTHGNLAVAYQALGAHDMALFHYRAHLGKTLNFDYFNVSEMLYFTAHSCGTTIVGDISSLQL